MNKLFVLINCCCLLIFPVLCDDGRQWLIINGSPARIGEFKAIVSFQEKHNNFHKCGGTIIAWNFIVTAAHCVLGEEFGKLVVINPRKILFVAGDVNIKGTGIRESRQTRYPKQIFPHPEYNSRTVANDIALVQTTRPFYESPYVNIIPLQVEAPEEKLICDVAGWGSMTYKFINTPDYLQKVTIEIKERDWCNSRERYNGKIPPNAICAGAIGHNDITEENLHDACQGDSGGPLICADHLTGVVSFGLYCGFARYPGVYTDITKFKDWMNTTMFNRISAYDGANSRLCVQLNLKWIMLLGVIINLMYCNVF